MPNLTAALVRSIKPTEKRKKYYDGQNLYLDVTPKGTKTWYARWWLHGKPREKRIGRYPEFTLALAREMAGQIADQGADKGTRTTFQETGDEWQKVRLADRSFTTRRRAMALLEGDVYPHVGLMTTGDIKTPDLIPIIRQIEARSPDIARRTRSIISRVFRFGMAMGHCDSNPAEPLSEIAAPVIKNNLPAVVDPKRLAFLLRLLWGYTGHEHIRVALRLQVMLYPRPGELRTARWDQIDLEAAEWTYKLSKTPPGKKPRMHTTPLPTQAVALLRGLKPVTGEDQFVFPSQRSTAAKPRPMNNVTIGHVYDAIGIDRKEQSQHGFRATANTILNQVHNYPYDWREHHLGHVVRHPNGTAYDRGDFLEQRRGMLQAWADYLDTIRADSNTGA